MRGERAGHPARTARAARWAALAALAWLAGCTVITTPVEPSTRFPAPAVPLQDTTVGLHLDASQRSFAHASTADRYFHWHFTLGAAQTALFETVAAGMFARVVALEDAARCGRCSAVLSPVLETVQFSTPDEGPTKAYEVWLRYRVSVLSPDGAETWHAFPVQAYGKAPARLKRKQGMQTATERALRDAGAVLVARWAQAPAAWRPAAEKPR